MKRPRGAPGAVAGVIALISVAGCASGTARHAAPLAVVDGDPVAPITASGKIDRLEHPRLVPLSAHGDPPFRNERILGLALGEPARMYPLGLLDRYGVVNDNAGGVPVAVARCPWTNLAAVLDRRVDGRVLTFESSGAAWRDLRLLRDRETGTLWNPATGDALFGPLAGRALARLPAAVTTAEAWRELYPATVCLDTGELTAVSLELRLYAASSRQGISGRKAAGGPFAPKETVFYVEQGGEVVAFTAADLRLRRRAEVRVGGRPVTLEWDGAWRAPRAFVPLLASRQEIPAVPIYGFALASQFPAARALPPGR